MLVSKLNQMSQNSTALDQHRVPFSFEVCVVPCRVLDSPTGRLHVPVKIEDIQLPNMCWAATSKRRHRLALSVGACPRHLGLRRQLQ